MDPRKGNARLYRGKEGEQACIRCSDTCELIFDEVEVPAENRLGEEGEGFQIMMKTLDFSRPSVAAQALGIAAGAFEHATACEGARIFRKAHYCASGYFIQTG